ncbi:sensor domain-containing protein [Kutzneria sp. CA-103260]|uniref:sensor domain-containing protein n=1 Tax=Kutzneria sp. CA-103260 TaxID=2802641 RepID=UPI001BAD9746|nr:sensor domain-containing protein [Kutzneria sp. CA-103260]
MRRLRLTGLAIGLSVVSVLGFVLVTCTVVAGLLSFTVLGGFLFLGLVAAQRPFTDLHLRSAEKVLGRSIPRTPRTPTEGGPLARFLTALSDTSTWRDIAFLFFNFISGMTILLVPVALFLHGLTALLLPVFWNTLPVGRHGFPYMSGFWVTSANEVQVGLGLAAVSFLLWWIFTPALLRLNALITAALLGSSSASAPGYAGQPQVGVR